MDGSDARTFEVRLETIADSLGWLIAWLPFDPDAVWPVMLRRRVLMQLGGETFRTSLFTAKSAVIPEQRRRALGLSATPAKVPRAAGHFVVVNKKMQKAAANARAGTVVEVTLAPDLAPAQPSLAPGLAKLFRGERALLKWYATLRPSWQRYITEWIQEPQSAEARTRRAGDMAERLMLTMEAEQELPPLLSRRLARTAHAMEGWQRLTPNCRRDYLITLFGAKSEEARENQLTRLTEACVARAKGRGAAPARGIES